MIYCDLVESAASQRVEGWAEIPLNLIDGGQTNRARPSPRCALISPVSLMEQLRASHTLLRE